MDFPTCLLKLWLLMLHQCESGHTSLGSSLMELINYLLIISYILLIWLKIELLALFSPTKEPQDRSLKKALTCNSEKLVDKENYIKPSQKFNIYTNKNSYKNYILNI